LFDEGRFEGLEAYAIHNCTDRGMANQKIPRGSAVTYSGTI
jgi:hypothetical protein